MHRFRIVSALAATAAAAVIAAGCGANSSAASRSTASTAATMVAGTLDEWSVNVDKKTVPAGRITFAIANRGKIVHEFVVLRTDKPAAALGKTRRISEAGNVGETGDVAAGVTKTVTLTLAPGHYALVCNIAGHYMSGMHADFTVT